MPHRDGQTAGFCLWIELDDPTVRTPPARAAIGGGVVTTQVFVYGTLLVGESNHAYLKGAPLLREVRTQPEFQLHDLGAFPGLVHGGTQAVVGEVYEVDEPTLVGLDFLEDHPQFYLRTFIVLADGSRVETYLLTAAQVAGHPIISSGSWRAHSANSRP
jgi:gamma-glutamylaminecyclotransferase